MTPNTLYFGDNLDWLGKLAGGSVDLIYLDPPFNSKRDYNLLYKTPAGHKSEAQVQAFTDTWSWDEGTSLAYEQLRNQPNTQLTELVVALRGFLREGDVMAYLVMMARRLLEMHRVLKDTGSLYLHCDPTASHYLKILLDAVFTSANFRSEVIWKRTTAHNSAKRYGPVHDMIFFYSKSSSYTWNPSYQSYDPKYLATKYRFTDAHGNRYRLSDLTGPGRRQGDSGRPWRGFDPTVIGRHWQQPSYCYDKYRELTGEELSQYPLIERLEKLDEVGLIQWPDKPDGRPEHRRYLADMPGVALQDVWTDIDPINARATERMGYPTQKPLALLERIIAASSNPGDVVLDPFCGCGTALHAAQKLGRRWIGIDITALAIDLIERRLRDAFPGIEIKVEGLPTKLEEAAALAARDKWLFQDWAVTKAGGQPYRGGVKGADGGIDGLIYFTDGTATRRAVISVKGGGNIAPTMVRDLGGLLDEQTPIGVFISLAEPTDAMHKYAAAAGFYRQEDIGVNPVLFPKLQLLTVADLLEGQRPRYPGAGSREITFRKAGREKRGKQGGLELKG